MTSKKAIKILQSRQSWINGTRKNQLNEGWKIQTEYYFKLFFKENSWPIKAFTDIEFPPISHQNYDVLYQSTLEKINKLLTVSIEIIKDVGIENPRKNFLSRIPEWLLIAILTTITSISFGVGRWWETHTFLKPLTPITEPVVTPSKGVATQNNDTANCKSGKDSVSKKLP